MADTITLNSGSGGAVIATDDITGTHYQIVKIAYGPLDSATLVTTSAGFPVDMLDRAARDCGKVDVAMGQAAHDAAGASIDPVAIGGYASAATPADVSADGDIARIWTTLKGAVHVADAGGSLTVDGSVAITSLVPGTAATDLGKAEDSAHTTADTGVYMLAVRDDSPTAHSGADGDYESLHVNAEGGLWGTLTPSASGGCSVFRSIDLDETEEEIKGTAGCVFGYYIANLHATNTRYVKLYNDTAANVTVGTTTPVWTLPVPAGSAANVSFPVGVQFSTAITAAATTGVADNDTGAPGANEVICNVFYK